MKKVIALIVAAIVMIAAPPWIRYYGVAYEMRNVPPARRAFEFDISNIDVKYLMLEALSIPVAIVLLLVAIALYIYEKKKIR